MRTDKSHTNDLKEAYRFYHSFFGCNKRPWADGNNLSSYHA